MRAGNLLVTGPEAGFRVLLRRAEETMAKVAPVPSFCAFSWGAGAASSVPKQRCSLHPPWGAARGSDPTRRPDRRWCWVRPSSNRESATAACVG